MNYCKSTYFVTIKEKYFERESHIMELTPWITAKVLISELVRITFLFLRKKNYKIKLLRKTTLKGRRTHFNWLSELLNKKVPRPLSHIIDSLQYCQSANKKIFGRIYHREAHFCFLPQVPGKSFLLLSVQLLATHSENFLESC